MNDAKGIIMLVEQLVLEFDNSFLLMQALLSYLDI